MKISKLIILGLNLFIVYIAYIYERVGGLIIELNADGTKVYAKDVLQGSCGDDSFIVAIGMIGFLIPLIGSIISMLKKANFKTVPLLNLAAVTWFTFWLLMANLDTSIIKSIFWGDYLLFSAICLSIVVAIVSIIQLFSFNLKLGKIQ